MELWEYKVIVATVLNMGVSWGDLFYPGNPERRRRVVKLSQKLYDYMKANFRATNALSEFLNTHTHEAHFSPISVDEDETIKFNSDLLCERIKEIQRIVEKVDKTLAEKLDPKAYKELTDVNLSFENRVQMASNVLHVVAGIVTTAAAIAVCVAIASGGILAPVVAVLGVVATSALATVVMAALGGLILDAIFQAITGAIERDKLEEAIKQLEHACDTFIPASEKYTDAIYEVLAELRMHELRH